MRIERLKPVRVALSLLLFCLTTAAFLDFSGSLAPGFVKPLTYLQFLPSLVAFIVAPGIIAAGFLIVLAATILLGRVYCSSICPLGTLQDLVIAASRRARRLRRKRVFFKLTPPHHVIRYGVLLVAAAAPAAGGMILLALLDPFSTFGRIAANLGRPAFLAANNAAAYLLERLQSYGLNRVQLNPAAYPSVALAALALAVVGWLAARHGRLYCNTVCPVGTLLGLVSRFSLFKVRIVADDCINCTLCERVCKSACIDLIAMAVDMSRCVGCFNCFGACPTGGMAYTWRKEPKGRGRVARVDGKKRRLLMLGAAALTGWSLGSAQKKPVEGSKPSTVVVRREVPVAPPGARSIDRFTAACTACHMCVSVCPTHVLSPSFLEYGITGILQPRMDYQAGFCNYDCTLCGDVCPSGAIHPLILPVKKVTQIGTATFVKENCIVYAENTDCGACSEHCPTKAVSMVPYKHLVAPEVKEEFCIGCGACEHACPTRPYKAIYVEGKRLHTVAKVREVITIPPPSPQEPDFPF